MTIKQKLHSQSQDQTFKIYLENQLRSLRVKKLIVVIIRMIFYNQIILGFKIGSQSKVACIFSIINE